MAASGGTSSACSTGGSASAGCSSDTEERGGGKIYGVSDDALKGLVASALYSKYAPGIDATGLTPEQARLKEMLVSFGVRSIFLQGLEAGAGWDVLKDNGAAFVKYRWGPVSENLSQVELAAHMFTSDRKFYPLGGGYLEWKPGEAGTTFSNETHVVLPVAGFLQEVRLRYAPFSFALGGGLISGLGGGGHLGLMFPVAERWKLGIFGGGGQDIYDWRKTTSGEAMLGTIYTLSTSGGEGMRLGSVTAALSGLSQKKEPWLDTGPTANAYQTDLTFGGNWYNASNGTLSVNIGIMSWGTVQKQRIDAATTTREASRLAGTLAVSYRAMQLGSRFLDPYLTISGRLGNEKASESVETSMEKTGTSTDRVDWSLSIKLGADLGYKPKSEESKSVK